MLAGYRVFADRPGADRSKEVRAEPIGSAGSGRQRISARPHLAA